MAQHVIDYDSAKHRMIRYALEERLQLSRTRMALRYGDFIKNEEQFQAYLPETEGDARRRKLTEQGRPQYTTLVVPYSYAVAMTAHTYWTSVFLSRTPVFQFNDRHGNGNTQAVEAFIDYQVNVGQMLVPLYIWLLDPARYGFGVLGCYWEEEEVTVSEIEEVPELFMGLPIPGKTRKQKVTRRIPGYRGNKVYNVRPQDFFPDPRVPLNRLQDGEFCARYVEVSWNTIRKREAAGRYFNVEHLSRIWSQTDRDKGSSQIQLPEGAEQQALSPPRLMGGKKKNQPFVALHEIYVELSPREWGLGESTRPEKWVFTFAENEVIIGAQPMGLYHDKFPFFIQEYEPQGYSLFSRSMMEVMQPLQSTLTWLINSHLHNVRKVLNDQLVVDPSRVVMKDLLDPNAGRLIRLRPEFYGTDPSQAVHQLQVVDITRTHLRDADVMTDLIQRVTGVTDNIMGLVNQGGRKTATEVRTSSTFGINRLKTNAEYMAAMGWAPLASVMLQNTQQFWDSEQQFRVAGAEEFVNVTPESIQGFYDYVPIDGTLPVDRFAQANLIRQFVADISQNPQAAGRYDILGLLNHAMMLMGIKNIKQFEVQIQPDEQVAQRAQSGDVVPFEEMLGVLGNQVGGDVGSTG